MAGLDGVQNKIEPPDPVDKDLYDLPPEELAQVPQVPASLDESLAALEADNDFLTAGGVFTDDLIETWIAYKRANEIDAGPAPAPPLGVHALLRHLIPFNEFPGAKRRRGPITGRGVPRSGGQLAGQASPYESLNGPTSPQTRNQSVRTMGSGPSAKRFSRMMPWPTSSNEK